jgi:hypothetical protein
MHNSYLLSGPPLIAAGDRRWPRPTLTAGTVLLLQYRLDTGRYSDICTRCSTVWSSEHNRGAGISLRSHRAIQRYLSSSGWQQHTLMSTRLKVHSKQLTGRACNRSCGTALVQVRVCKDTLCVCKDTAAPGPAAPGQAPRRRRRPRQPQRCRPCGRKQGSGSATCFQPGQAVAPALFETSVRRACESPSAGGGQPQGARAVCVDVFGADDRCVICDMQGHAVHPHRASMSATSCGVDTTTAPESGSRCPSPICASPVPACMW